jgi:glycosyltransferase involved in cell wall biosynthesis
VSSISVYTATSNAIENEYCIEEGIKSALLFADEVVVVDSGSTDGTLELIKSIGDSRIKIYHNDWLDRIGRGMYASQKNMSLGRCTSEWCVLMDSDEVYHEEDAERIKRTADSMSDNVVAVKFNTLHFYRDYDHIMNGCGMWKDLYDNKVYMVKNGLSIHHGAIGYDPDGHVMNDCMPIPQDKTFHSKVFVYHYGHARTRRCYINKQNKIDMRYNPSGVLAFKPVPEDKFEFVPSWKLTKFTGTHPAVMGRRIEAGTEDHDKIVSVYANKLGERV